MMPDELTEVFRGVFGALRSAGYEWEPMIPDRLLECRRHPEAFTVLQRFFGLGGEAAELSDELLVDAGIPSALLAGLRQLRSAVSRWKDLFIPHTHWPHTGPHTGTQGGGVYAGRESFELARKLEAAQGAFEGKRVLDLGSGSGVLAFSLAGRASEVCGLESSSDAVDWSNANARAQDILNTKFICTKIGDAEAEIAMEGELGNSWDAAVFNPPFAIPSGASRPVRDGGILGIELPLQFLDFAHRRLKPCGRAYCFIANPIVDGQGVFFDRLCDASWSVVERELRDARFNHSIYRKEGYAQQGIERVELWYLVLEVTQTEVPGFLKRAPAVQR